MWHPHDNKTDFEEEPVFSNCDHCDQRELTEHLCPVPKDGTPTSSNIIGVLWVCVGCYEETCEEEGYNPQ